MDLPLGRLNGSFAKSDAEEEIDRVIGPRADSWLSPVLRERASPTAATSGRDLTADLAAVAAMLRTQCDPSQASSGVDAGARREAMAVREEKVQEAERRLRKP